MKGCADKSILGLALAAQYLSHGTYLTACWAKKRQAFFAIKVELGDPLIFHSKVPEFHGFFLALAVEISLRVLV